MATLTDQRMVELLGPYLPGRDLSHEPVLLSQLSAYLDLLVRWNARTNLTAIRDPEEMVRRHFGESLYAASVLGPLLADGSSLLDFGSGAGFPGVPMQLFRPDLRVTLGESQNKKATFLREVVRTLGLSTEVHSGRVEGMEGTRQFDAVAMRAVDDMGKAVEAARQRVAEGGVLCLLTSREEAAPEGMAEVGVHAMPGAKSTVVALYRAG